MEKLAKEQLMSSCSATNDADVLVIGAGPAGLSVAQTLTEAGRRVEVLEMASDVASTWRAHRAGLRLHTMRRHSGLPGTDIPRAYGQHPSSTDLVRYFEAYARENNLDISFGVKVSSIEPMSAHDKRWTVRTESGDCHAARTVVVATGHNREPHVPDLPGRSTYERPLMHVTDYRGGIQFSGMDVLVMGAGNAAAEASTELVRAGAGRVRMSVRTAPHIRRDVWGIPAQVIAIVLSRLPVRWADRASALLAAMTIPDMARMGLPRPESGLFTRATRDNSVPVHDTGIVRLIQSGAVESVTEVLALEGDGVRLADGSLIYPDVVIAATGYRRGLASLLGRPGLNDEHGGPPRHHVDAALAGLHFVGFTSSGAGALRDISADATRVARSEGVALGPVPLHWLSTPHQFSGITYRGPHGDHPSKK